MRFRFISRNNVAGAIDVLSTKYQIFYQDDSFSNAELSFKLLGLGKISDIVRAKNAKSEVHKLMRIQLGIHRPTVVIFLKRINRIKLRYDIL